MKFLTRAVDTFTDTKCLHAALPTKKYQSSCIHSHCFVVVVIVLCIIFKLTVPLVASCARNIVPMFGYFWRKVSIWHEPLEILVDENILPTKPERCTRMQYEVHFQTDMEHTGCLDSVLFFLVSDSGICVTSSVGIACSCFSRRVG